MRAVAMSVGVLSFVAGCPDRSVSELVPEQNRVEQKNTPLVVNNDVDILFVIDDSISMDDEQASLIANFDRFIDVLDNIQGGLPDVHIGVATSNMGSFGVINDGRCDGMGDDGMLHLGGAVVQNGDLYLSDVAGPTPGTRITNYDQGGTVSLTTAFAQTALVGTVGCGFEQHLASMQRAVTNPVNGTFIRDEAHLAVVIVADEDDCSASGPGLFGAPSAQLGPMDSFRCFEFGVECDEDPRVFGTHTNCRPREPSPFMVSPTDYVNFLDALKPGSQREVIVAGIIGDHDEVVVEQNPDETELWPVLHPSCPPPAPASQRATPGIRLAAVIEAFTTNGTETSICNQDLSSAIEQVGELIASHLDDSCIRNQLADTDPSTPELDYECQVSLVSDPEVIDGFDTPIPECDAGATRQPCWRLVPDPVQCVDFPTGLKLEIVRSVEPPDGTRIVAACVVE